jgi:glycosyltransferase involved in cell wall biosynthesis
MQLGLVSTFGVKCGLSTYSTYLGNALQNSKISVTGLSEFPFPDEKAITPDFQPKFPFFNCWKRTEFYDRLIKESHNYDIIHIQHQFGLFNNTYAWIQLLQKIKKPILTIHDIVPPNEQLSTYFTETFHHADRLIVHTNTCKNMLESWNCPKDKIELIPHGTKLIDVPTKTEARKELQLPENAKIILSWGFIWESKGLLELTNILSEVKKTYPEAILIHAGGVHPILQKSQYVANILKAAIKSGLGPKDLIITQWVPEDKVPTWFGAADVIVLNYMRGSASASGAAHRAMAGHRPIIKTDDPCVEDITGYTVARFDINALYNAILKVLQDEVLQKTLVEQAEKASIETSWQNVALKHKKLYGMF